MEKSGEEVWEVARFSASVRALINRLFCNYGFGLVLLNLSPFL